MLLLWIYKHNNIYCYASAAPPFATEEAKKNVCQSDDTNRVKSRERNCEVSVWLSPQSWWLSTGQQWISINQNANWTHGVAMAECFSSQPGESTKGWVTVRRGAKEIIYTRLRLWATLIRIPHFTWFPTMHQHSCLICMYIASRFRTHRANRECSSQRSFDIFCSRQSKRRQEKKKI